MSEPKTGAGDSEHGAVRNGAIKNGAATQGAASKSPVTKQPATKPPAGGSAASRSEKNTEPTGHPAPAPRALRPPRTPRASPVASRKPLIRWDVALFVILSVAATIVSVALGIAGAGLSLLSDACSTLDCNDSLLAVSVLAAILAPLLVVLASVTAGIVRVRRRRVSFWLPLAGLALAVGVWLGASALAASSVPGQSLFG